MAKPEKSWDERVVGGEEVEVQNKEAPKDVR